jgi:hypothetical protein
MKVPVLAPVSFMKTRALRGIFKAIDLRPFLASKGIVLNILTFVFCICLEPRDFDIRISDFNFLKEDGRI